jgi:hypothetical protein
VLSSYCCQYFSGIAFKTHPQLLSNASVSIQVLVYLLFEENKPQVKLLNPFLFVLLVLNPFSSGQIIFPF